MTSADGDATAKDPLAALNDYELRNLVPHLVAAGRDAALHQMIRLPHSEIYTARLKRAGIAGLFDRVMRINRHAERTREENAWFRKKDASGLLDSFFADLTLATRAAHDAAVYALTASQPAHQAALQIRYALMTCSVNEVAGRIPPEITAVLVERGVWTERQGLTYARHVVDPKTRASVLIALFPVLEESVRASVAAEVFDAFAQVPNRSSLEIEPLCAHLAADELHSLVGHAVFAGLGDRDRAGVLAAVSGRLAALGHVSESLDLAATLTEDYAKSSAIVAIAPFLDERQSSRAARLTDGIHEVFRETALGAVLARGIGFSDPHAAFATIDRLSRPINRARALIEASRYLPPHLIPEVIRRVREMSDVEDRAKVLVACVQRVEQPERDIVLDELFAVLSKIDGSQRSGYLNQTAQFLGGERVAQALRLAQDSSIALLKLAGRLPVDRRAPVIRRAVRGWNSRRDGLSSEGFAEWAELEPENALEAASASLSSGSRAPLEAVARRLPRALLPRLLDQYAHVQDVQSERATVRGRLFEQASARIIGELAAFDPDESLNRIRGISDQGLRAEALAAAARWLSAPLAESALTIALSLKFEDPRVAALCALAHRLPAARVPEAASACLYVKTWRVREATHAFAPYLDDADLEQVLARAKDQEDAWRGWIITELAPHLTPALVDRALTMTGTISSAFQQLHARGALAVRIALMGDPMRGITLLADATDGYAEPTPNIAEWFAESLAAIPPLPATALASARRIADERGYLPVLGVTARQLAGHDRATLVEEVWRRALEPDPNDGEEHLHLQTAALATLAPCLDEERLRELVAILLEHDPNAIVGVAPFLPQSLHAAARAPQPQMSTGSRARLLAILASRAAAAERRDLLSEAMAVASSDLDIAGKAHHWGAIRDAMGPLSVPDQYSLISQHLHLLATSSRSALLVAIRELAGVIGVVGGAQAVRDTASAMDDVLRWWP